MRIPLVLLLFLAGGARADGWDSDFDPDLKLDLDITNINRVVDQALSVTPVPCSADITYDDRSTVKVKLRPRGSFHAVTEVNDGLKDLTVVSESRARALFERFRKDKSIPFKYPEDGCYARAHLMAREMEEMGIICGKAFVYGDLKANSPYPEKCGVGWWYHVAPVLKVKTKKGIELRILDPSLMSGPASPEEWTAKQSPLRQATMEYTSRFAYQALEGDTSDWSVDDLNRMDEKLAKYSRRVEERVQRAPPEGKECVQ